MKIKSFETLAPGVNIIKLFIFVTDAGKNKLERFCVSVLLGMSNIYE
jgi:hypothetical protein